MIIMQVIPKAGLDAYKLVRDKVTHEAQSFKWDNKAKTRLTHINSGGYIEISSVEGVLVAQIKPKSGKDQFFLSEKLIGRIIDWFEDSLIAINIQFINDKKNKKR